MENINYPFLAWAAFGVIGWFILSRNPSKFLFDDLNITTVVTVLMAFLLPIWGGPIFLIIVLLVPRKKPCIHCKRVIPERETICRHCQNHQDVLTSQLEVILEQDEQRNQQFVTLSKKYGKWDILVLPIFLVSAPVVGYISWFLLTKISDFRYSYLPQGVFAFLPSHAAWMIIALFIGIIGSAVPMYLSLRLALGKSYAEYKKFQSMKSAGNATKSGVLFLGFFTVLCFAAVILMLDCYTVAYQDRLVINQFWGLGEKHYLYGDVTAVRSSMQLKQAKWDHPIYVLDFKDGSKWSTRWDIDERDSELVNDFFVFVADQSSCEIEYVSAFSDSDVK